MAGAIADAFVAIRPDMKRFPAEVTDGVNKADLDGDGKKAGSKFGGAFGAAVGTAAAVGLVKFGADSISAFKDAEVAQARLSDAFAKFPALADSNKAAFDRLNESVAKKTRFDDDALASGQAVLAQFGLTGTQITELTPLLADYAAKTGKDAPDAAQALGKALLGQGRALKDVGIDFQDAGSVGANFDQIMGGLRTQVGGFAEKEGKTAAGQSEILKNRFGEFQELVGQKLIPILQTLATAGIATIAWIEDNNKIVVTAAAVFGVLAGVLVAVKVATLAQAAATTIASVATGVWTAATWLLNVAMAVLTSPITLVILAVAALAAGVVYAYKNFDTFRNVVDTAWKVVQKAVEIAWNYYYKPILAALGEAFTWVWEKAQQFANILGIAFRAVQDAGLAAYNFLDKYFISPMQTAFDKIADVVGKVKDFIGSIAGAGSKFVGAISGVFGSGGPNSASGAIASSNGRAFPLPGGAGAYRITNGPHPNNAIDYGAPTGTPVYASYSGALTTTDLGNKSYGKYFRLSGQGAPILGAHLSSFARGSGPINKGDLIGYTGSTGNSTGPHLHLENFDKGGWLQPHSKGGSLGVNLTNKPERVLPNDQPITLSADSIEAIAVAMIRGVQAHTAVQARRTVR